MPRAHLLVTDCQFEDNVTLAQVAVWTFVCVEQSYDVVSVNDGGIVCIQTQGVDFFA